MPGVILRQDTFGSGAGALDATYTQQRTSGTVNYDGSGNAVASTTNTWVLAYDNSNTYPADQYSKVTCGVLETDLGYNRATTRSSGTGDSNINLYAIQTSGTHIEMMEWVAGVETSIYDIPATVVGPGDLMELESVGPIHSVVLNDIVLGIHTDATHADGQAGLGLYDEAGGPSPTMQAWEGGSLEVPVPIRNRKLATQQRMVT